MIIFSAILSTELVIAKPEYLLQQAQRAFLLYEKYLSDANMIMPYLLFQVFTNVVAIENILLRNPNKLKLFVILISQQNVENFHCFLDAEDSCFFKAFKFFIASL